MVWLYSQTLTHQACGCGAHLNQSLGTHSTLLSPAAPHSSTPFQRMGRCAPRLGLAPGGPEKCEHQHTWLQAS